MAILVTGGAGYIGSHMVLALCEQGAEVLVLDHLSTGFAWSVDPRARLIQGDIGDKELVVALLKEHSVKEVLHFAGSVVVPESVRNPLFYYENNTAKSRTLIESCLLGGVERFLFSSTAAVYGTPHEREVHEGTPLAPLSPYGASKAMTERILEDCALAYGLSATVLRYFNVAGADPLGRIGQSTHGATHLIKVACQVALKQRPFLEIFGTDYPTHDGTGVRDYIHVNDLISAHLCALEWMRSGNTWGIFNCGYGHGYSVYEVRSAVEKVAQVSLPITLSPRRAGDVPEIVACAEKAKSLLRWRPQYDHLETIVETALLWEKYLASRNA